MEEKIGRNENKGKDVPSVIGLECTGLQKESRNEREAENNMAQNNKGRDKTTSSVLEHHRSHREDCKRPVGRGKLCCRPLCQQAVQE